MINEHLDGHINCTLGTLSLFLNYYFQYEITCLDKYVVSAELNSVWLSKANDIW